MAESDAPEKVWIAPHEAEWRTTQFHDGDGIEYVRADLAAPVAAQQAAKEIHALCDELTPDTPGDSTSYAPSVKQIAAIIVKHFATTDAVRQSRREAWKAAIETVRSLLKGGRGIAVLAVVEALEAAALRADGEKGDK